MPKYVLYEEVSQPAAPVAPVAPAPKPKEPKTTPVAEPKLEPKSKIELKPEPEAKPSPVKKPESPPAKGTVNCLCFVLFVHVLVYKIFIYRLCCCNCPVSIRKCIECDTVCCLTCL